MEFEVGKFESMFEIFKRIDAESHPFSFVEFWKRKSEIEKTGDNILSNKYIGETYNRLARTLIYWQWSRPYSFNQFAPALRASLQNIAVTYKNLRKYSLLDFSKIPEDELRLIWNELGAVKDGGKNEGEYYLVMAATKPLMFLWGQTLAYDSVVRRLMPKLGHTGLSYCSWDFQKWKKVTASFSDLLIDKPELVQTIKKLSIKLYGADSNVPYGQFLDAYLWASDPKRSKKVCC